MCKKVVEVGKDDRSLPWSVFPWTSENSRRISPRTSYEYLLMYGDEGRGGNTRDPHFVPHFTFLLWGFCPFPRPLSGGQRLDSPFCSICGVDWWLCGWIGILCVPGAVGGSSPTFRLPLFPGFWECLVMLAEEAINTLLQLMSYSFQ